MVILKSAAAAGAIAVAAIVAAQATPHNKRVVLDMCASSLVN
ncbi:MAG: hypothetical protein M5U08_20530 [Burkholderiales bacterium]|nr:hypothetical protein [Burkholderiales bacterium]